MNKRIKLLIIVFISIIIVLGTVFGSLKIYDYIIELRKQRAEYDSVAMVFDYADTNPAEFYQSRNTKQEINLVGLSTDKDKILHILQVADYNYANSKYLGRFRVGETTMTASINKPICRY